MKSSLFFFTSPKTSLRKCQCLKNKHFIVLFLRHLKLLFHSLCLQQTQKVVFITECLFRNSVLNYAAPPGISLLGTLRLFERWRYRDIIYLDLPFLRSQARIRLMTSAFLVQCFTRSPTKIVGFMSVTQLKAPIVVLF